MTGNAVRAHLKVLKSIEIRKITHCVRLYIFEHTIEIAPTPQHMPIKSRNLFIFTSKLNENFMHTCMYVCVQLLRS